MALALTVSAEEYVFHVLLSVEYCFFALSVLNVALTVTLLFVMAVVETETVGLAGAVLSMFDTLQVVTLERFPALSVPRK